MNSVFVLNRRHAGHVEFWFAGKAILIVTEGEVTEPAYFGEIKRKISSLTVELVTH